MNSFVKNLHSKLHETIHPPDEWEFDDIREKILQFKPYTYADLVNPDGFLQPYTCDVLRHTDREIKHICALK